MADFLSYGQSKGLAYQHDWQSDIDTLYKREAYSAQQQALAEQKTAHYAQMMKKPDNIRSEYNNARVNEFYTKKMQEIGNFAMTNPGFERDIGLMATFNNMTSELVNNDIVREELQVQEEFSKLKANAHNLTADKYAEEMERYLAYVNQDPGNPEKVDPYFFNNFLVVDPMDIVERAVKSMATVYQEMKYKGQDVLGERFAQSWQDNAWNYFTVADNRKAIENHFSQLDEGTKELHSGSAYEWFKHAIKAQEDKKFLHTMLDKNAGETTFFSDRSNFFRDIGQPLIAGNLRYMNNSQFVHATAFGDNGVTLSLRSLRENGGVYVMNEKGEPVVLDVPTHYRSIKGGGEVKEIDGRYFVSVAVITDVDASETSGMNPAASGSRLEGFGFKAAGELTEGMLSQMQLTKQDIKNTAVRHTGEIWVPMELSEAASDRYNNATKISVEQVKGFNPMYDQHAITYNNLNSYFRSLGQNNPLQGTDDRVGVKVGNGWGISAKLEDGSYGLIVTDSDGRPKIIPSTREEHNDAKRQAQK
jgi:hypothetical protein